MARKEATRVLHSDSMDADDASEYREFSGIRDAMAADGYEKVVAEINPLDREDNPDIVVNQLAERLRGYSVQIFVNHDGGNLQVLIIARQEGTSQLNVGSSIRKAENVLESFIWDNYPEERAEANYFESESISPRNFSAH